MHLQEHAGVELGGFEGVVHADHGAADDVGGAALDRGIDGLAFREHAHVGALVLDRGEVGAAAEDGLDIALFLHLGFHALHIVRNAGEFLEIGVDEGLGLLAGDVELVGQAEGGNPVDHAEIDRLGLAADHRVHAFQRHVEDFRGGHGVDVDPVAEGLFETVHTGDMGQQAQFHLGIVGRDQAIARLGDEDFADLAAGLGADRDVLQVRLGRGQAPRRRRRQRERPMHPLGVGVDMVEERVRIGGFQLGILAVFQERHRQLMPLGGQLVQHRRIRRPGTGLGLLAAGQAHLAEQDFADLLGRAQIELAARRLVRGGFGGGHFLGEIRGELAQLVRIDLDARPFHIREHLGHRSFQRLVDGGFLLGDDSRFQDLPQAQRHISVFRRILRRLVQRHLVERDLVLAGATDFLERNALMAQMQLGQLIHAMLVQAGIHHIGDQHRVVIGRDMDAIARQNAQIILDVLAHLQDRLVLQQILQRLQRRIHVQLVRRLSGIEHVAGTARIDMGQRDVTGHTRRRGHRHADQSGRRRGEGVRLGIHRHHTGFARPFDPGVQRLHRRHALIILAIDRRRCITGLVRRRSAQRLFHLAGEGAEFHLFQEGHQDFGVRIAQAELVHVLDDRRVHFQRHQIAGDPCVIGMGQQLLAAALLLDLAGPLQERVQIAIFIDQQRGRLDADAWHAGHIVDTVAGQGLDIDHLVRPDAELLEHLFRFDALVLHRIEHLHLVTDQLHQILVRGDDGHFRALGLGLAGIGRDDVVGLVILQLHTGRAKGARRIADDGELRHQILRCRRPVRLVLVVHLIAEGLAGMVEDHRQVRGRILALQILQKLPQHVAEPLHRPHRRPVCPRQRRQRMIGPENIARPVDQIEMGVLVDGLLDGHGGGPLRMRRARLA
jgi:hypothetical protein